MAGDGGDRGPEGASVPGGACGDFGRGGPAVHAETTGGDGVRCGPGDV
ncbi:hypothetical protein CCP3SC1AL1_770019 [Gammaproteobacteria bacterium]